MTKSYLVELRSYFQTFLWVKFVVLTSTLDTPIECLKKKLLPVVVSNILKMFCKKLVYLINYCFMLFFF